MKTTNNYDKKKKEKCSAGKIDTAPVWKDI